MNFLWAILIGAGLGILSGFLTKRRDPGSIIVTMLIGILGGIIGGVVAEKLAPVADAGIWISASGAVVLLFIYWLIVGKRKTT
jgi:uncharacterized membrane protein YeaQ/YmgE (transglycosylase-associated protein family)